MGRGFAVVADEVREIADALREQSAASADIAKNVETIAQMAEENSAAVAESHTTVDEPEKLAGSLQREVSRFKTA